MEEKTFEYKGNRLKYYHSKGSSGSVVLMHGYNFNSMVWKQIGLIDELKRRDFNVFAIDVPGFPRSINKFKLNEEEMMDLLKQFMNSISGKAAMLGSSASGYIALRFAEKNSAKLKGLVVVGPVMVEKVDLKKIKANILGIWGGNDEISPPALFAKKLEENANAKTYIMEGARHACYLDQPKQFISLVSEFIQRMG